MGAPVIPYVQQSWSDGSSQCNAARNGVHEDGIRDAHYMPAVRVYHNTTQSHTTSGTYQAVVFNSERYDQAGNAASTQHDTAGNTSRLTCRFAGIYAITGHLEFASNGTGDRQVTIRLNGSTIIATGPITPGSDDLIGRVLVTTQYALAVNDYVELLAFQSSGGALNIASTANSSPEFMMVRVA